MAWPRVWAVGVMAFDVSLRLVSDLERGLCFNFWSPGGKGTVVLCGSGSKTLLLGRRDMSRLYVRKLFGECLEGSVFFWRRGRGSEFKRTAN